MDLRGSCECGDIAFTATSDAPYPYRVCYCRRCRKIAGGSGAAINILADAGSLRVEGATPSRYPKPDGGPITSFCPRCGTALFVELPAWPQWIYPFASAVDTPLPVPPSFVHIQLAERVPWTPIAPGIGDEVFEANTNESIVEWHERQRGQAGA